MQALITKPQTSACMRKSQMLTHACTTHKCTALPACANHKCFGEGLPSMIPSARRTCILKMECGHTAWGMPQLMHTCYMCARSE
eukprot:1161673-Pelagomonas_calceolata.AAC.1